MTFNRLIINDLEDWKKSSNRKPLILRGARQVGKTTLVKQFAKNYSNAIFLNLEKAEHLNYFETYDNVLKIINALLLNHNIPSSATKNTLLFIDEIQESPKAIQLLRYFYEELPELHVIAAGSLLEFAMRHIKSFPVGRVEYLYLYPLNFIEYLKAIEHHAALEQIEKIPLSDFAHNTLIELFNEYAIIGGMPEIVKTYTESKSLSDLPKVYESIWESYKNDVEKYTSHEADRKVIKHVMGSAHLYVDQRIKFQNFGNSNYKSREVGEAMRNLDAAKIIQLIYPTTEKEPPVKPDLRKSPRLQFLDTGLLNYTLGIQAELLALKDLSNSYKGAIIPHLITQELMSLNTISSSKPNFWVREKSQASSEVDLVVVYKDKLIPIEIKSGSIGKLKSLHQFIDRSKHPYAVRIYAGEFSVEKHQTNAGNTFLLMNLPYYLGTKIPDYIAHFVEEYKV
ncbi:MAG: AAA family ATPase [Chitinophagales bacterium]